jgi:hypothetical protein
LYGPVEFTYYCDDSPLRQAVSEEKLLLYYLEQAQAMGERTIDLHDGDGEEPCGCDLCNDVQAIMWTLSRAQVGDGFKRADISPEEAERLRVEVEDSSCSRPRGAVGSM